LIKKISTIAENLKI